MIFIFNGEPASGKDTLTEFLENYLKHRSFNVMHMRFKDKIYELIATVRDMNLSDVIKICNDRNNKEKPCIHFGGRTPREEMIYVSEVLMKPNYGKDYFGHVSVDRVNNLNNIDHFIFSDGGFQEEVDVLSEFTDHYVAVLQVVRPNNKVKTSDSRSKVFGEMDGLTTEIINHDGKIDDTYKQVIAQVEQWLSFESEAYKYAEIAEELR